MIAIATTSPDHILKGHGGYERKGLDDERCKREILCTEKDLNGPKICGTNGKTYSNPCELNRSVCFGIPVEMHRMGDCQPSERCPLERDFQLKLIRSNAKKYSNEFVPICDKNTKLYAQIQCHSVIGYCWCSTSHGSPIPSTSVAISTQKMPDCHHLNALHVGANGKIEKLHLSTTTNATDCGNVERIIFNSNILDVYRREYENAPEDDISLHRGDDPSETLERKILIWRFSKLDLDGNGHLSGDELESERRLTVLVVKPTSCARTFHKFCDKNADLLIDLTEWTTCLKIDFSTNVLPEPNDDNTLPIYELPTKPPTTVSSQSSHEGEDPAAIFLESITKKAEPELTLEKPNCKLDREKIMASVEPRYLDTIFIPKCTGGSDRFYTEVQCHQKPTRKFCWCVHPITGEPTGSSLVTSADECKKASKKKTLTKIGSIKGCLPEKQLLFYRKLFDLLTKEMREQVPPISNGPKRRKPQVAKWKFTKLDSNNNSVIERNEWKEFKATLRELKNVRKCGRNFLRFCDINKDGRITRREWMRCTVHAYRHAKTSKPNPFLTMLKSID